MQGALKTRQNETKSQLIKNAFNDDIKEFLRW